MTRMTLLAIRRELIGDRRLPLVPPKALVGTKSRALIWYTRYLSAEEFTRLATLLRNIAASVVYTCNPRNLARMHRGDGEAIRANLDLIL